MSKQTLMQDKYAQAAIRAVVGSNYRDPNRSSAYMQFSAPPILEVLYDTPQEQTDWIVWHMMQGTINGYGGGTETLAIQTGANCVMLYTYETDGIPTQCGGRHVYVAPAILKTPSIKGTHARMTLAAYLDVMRYHSDINTQQQRYRELDRIYASHNYSTGIGWTPPFRIGTTIREPVYNYNEQFNEWSDPTTWQEPYNGYSAAGIHAGIGFIDVNAATKGELKILKRVVERGVYKLKELACDKHGCMRMFRHVSYTSVDIPALRTASSTNPRRPNRFVGIVHLKTDDFEIEEKVDHDCIRLGDDHYDQSAAYARESHPRLFAVRDAMTYDTGDTYCTPSTRHSPSLGRFMTQWWVKVGLNKDAITLVLEWIDKYMDGAPRVEWLGFTSNLCNYRHTSCVMKLLRDNPDKLAEHGWKAIYPDDVAINQGEGFHVIDSLLLVRSNKILPEGEAK